MKKAIIASILCLSSIWTGMAQSKGDMALGGDLGLSTTQMIHTKEAGGYYLNYTQHYGTTFTIAPKFSYFAADNFEMDLSVGYTLSGDFFGDGEFMHVLDGSIGMHYYVHIIRNRFFYTPGFNFVVRRGKERGGARQRGKIQSGRYAFRVRGGFGIGTF